MPERFLNLSASEIYVATTVLENAIARIDIAATGQSPEVARRVLADYIVANISSDESDIPDLVDGCVRHLKRSFWMSAELKPRFRHYMKAA